VTPERHEIGTSDFVISRAPAILATSGIGSCIAICLYNRAAKAGALLHVMLPRSEGGGLNPLRFADTALNAAMEELQAQGLEPASFTAKLVGGAQMFKAFDSDRSVGRRNIAEVERILGTLGIEITGEDTGGTQGRSLEFDLDTGLVKIYSYDIPQLN
jgi:chemotaxis protein CheD